MAQSAPTCRPSRRWANERSPEVQRQFDPAGQELIHALPSLHSPEAPVDQYEFFERPVYSIAPARAASRGPTRGGATMARCSRLGRPDSAAPAILSSRLRGPKRRWNDVLPPNGAGQRRHALGRSTFAGSPAGAGTRRSTVYLETDTGAACPVFSASRGLSGGEHNHSAWRLWEMPARGPQVGPGRSPGLRRCRPGRRASGSGEPEAAGKLVERIGSHHQERRA